MPQSASQLTDSEIIERAGTLHRRLTKHLDGWDGGNEDSMEDVAAVTRTLLAFGKGDAVVQRLCDRFHLTPPLIEVGIEVARPSTTTFALARIPTSEDERGEDPENRTPITKIPLREWLQSTAVISETASRKSTTWAQLVTDFGNTFGAHISSSVPDVLNHVDFYQSPRGTFGGLALRSAAIVAENSMNELMPQLGGSRTTTSPRLFHSGGPGITYFDVRDEGSRTTATVGFFGSPDTPDGIDMIAVPLRDQTLRLSWSTQSDGTGSVTMSFV